MKKVFLLGVHHQMVRHRHVKLSRKVNETISNTDP